jgi:hypothetical protein
MDSSSLQCDVAPKVSFKSSFDVSLIERITGRYTQKFDWNEQYGGSSRIVTALFSFNI